MAWNSTIHASLGQGACGLPAVAVVSVPEQHHSDLEHLQAAAAWLERAQDATPDGGVVGRYRLNVGWTSSYPETTGYLIPTLLDLADFLEEPRFRQRAERAVSFLLGLQHDNGAFPGNEVHENTDKPSPFNTGQILNGLVVWHAATGDETAGEAARRAGDWLLSVQDEDGAFRKYFYYDQPSTYSAHQTCWLAQLGVHVGKQKYLDAVDRHLDWLLTNFDDTAGWFSGMGFDAAQHEARTAFTHTIAYTIWGVLFSAQALGRADALAAAEKAAAGVRDVQTRLGRLPGLLGANWQPAGDFCCLTGNAQMALIWLRLYEQSGDKAWLDAAQRAIDEIKLRHPLRNANPAIAGGVPGSFPIWGDYIFGGLPNWAAKFFIDALLHKHRLEHGGSAASHAAPTGVTASSVSAT